LGWAGVQLFFVISGFLISGILLDSKGNSHYFRSFYIRRCLRIFPIYYLTLLAVIAVALCRGWPLTDWYWYPVYLQNYHIANTGFHPQFPEIMNHSWSLAIEEQFYLVWPLAIYLLGRRGIAIFCSTLIVLAPLSRLAILKWTGATFGVIAYTPCALDLLSMGAILALLLRSQPVLANWPKTRRWMILAGAGSFVLLLTLVLLNHGERHWRLGDERFRLAMLSLVFLLMATFFASVIGLSILGGGHLSKLLRMRWLSHIGRISYGIYMYHVPVFYVVDVSFVKFGWTSNGSLAQTLCLSLSKVLATYLVALLSWHQLEKRFLSLKDRFSYVAVPHSPTTPTLLG
jgi:peptidoglycan/LPS O-acetylase OafA/YrhL